MLSAWQEFSCVWEVIYIDCVAVYCQENSGLRLWTQTVRTGPVYICLLTERVSISRNVVETDMNGLSGFMKTALKSTFGKI